MGKATETIFFNNLIKEINLYNNNKNNAALPKIIDSFYDDKVCILILDKIEGEVLAKNRNDYTKRIKEENRIKVVESIINIKNIKVNLELDNSYNRKEKLDKYLGKCKPYISTICFNKVKKIYDEIITVNTKEVVSHGDLILPNIFLVNNNVFFIDWEYISLKPDGYDLVYFLLFSKNRNALEILKSNNFGYDVHELYKDGIILCLKEIQNWAKLFGKVEDIIVNKNINRWKKELNYILRGF